MSEASDERARIYLTPEGVRRLREEEGHLVKVKRPALADRLRFAIQQGDLSENADYTTAKEEQGFLEGRIQQIGAILRRAIVVDREEDCDRVALGHHVTVVEVGTDYSEVYQIVGFAEADPSGGKVSCDSPLGQALMDRSVGDLVTVRAPAGELSFEITAIA
jgi:transcription elongation factor GreA